MRYGLLVLVLVGTLWPSGVGAQQLEPGDTAIVRGVGSEGLRARAEPSLGASVIFQLSEGDRVSVSGRPMTADGYRWYLVRPGVGVDAGDAGWVAADFLVASPLLQAQPQTILDMQFYSNPRIRNEGCIVLEPGLLAITVRRLERVVSSAEPIEGPLLFEWNGLMGAGPTPSTVLSVTTTPQTAQVSLTGGRYCWQLVNEAPMPPDTPNVGMGPYLRLAHVRIDFTPAAR